MKNFSIKVTLPLKEWDYSRFYWMLRLPIPDLYQVTVRVPGHNEFTAFMDWEGFNLHSVAGMRPDIVAVWHIKPLNNSSNTRK